MADDVMTEYNKFLRKQWSTNYYHKNKEEIHKKIKERRTWVVTNLIKTGKIKPQNCIVCNSEKAQAHHENYDKLLDITWLCAKHHQQRHSKKRHKVDDIIEKVNP